MIPEPYRVFAFLVGLAFWLVLVVAVTIAYSLLGRPARLAACRHDSYAASGRGNRLGDTRAHLGLDALRLGNRRGNDRRRAPLPHEVARTQVG